MCGCFEVVSNGHADHYPQPLCDVPCYTQVWVTSNGLLPMSSLGSLYCMQCAIFMSCTQTRCFIHSKCLTSLAQSGEHFLLNLEVLYSNSSHVQWVTIIMWGCSARLKTSFEIKSSYQELSCKYVYFIFSLSTIFLIVWCLKLFIVIMLNNILQCRFRYL